jgi:dTDP-4-amino-4,6-dideoxygalactose transaminase
MRKIIPDTDEIIEGITEKFDLYSNKRIFVTKPFLPPLEEFTVLLEQIWKSGNLTNDGPFHEQFEKELADYLGVKYISLLSNGTLALMIAVKALDIDGEVITTPYTYAATTHSLWWNGIKPVFADIELGTCNLDPDKIEAAISPKTVAILPVHIYGNPCNVTRIREIAELYGLKVIYDACHAFGVKLNGQTLLNYGDLSVVSFHATKVFTTFEGGAVICHDSQMKKRIDILRRCGYDGETKVEFPGINAKMTEFQAALGLLQLKYIDRIIIKRKKICIIYRELLSDIGGLGFQDEQKNVESNYAYFPVFIEEKEFGISRDQLDKILKEHYYFGRRYFYPLISQLPIYKDMRTSDRSILAIAEQKTQEVLCLPIYPELDFEEVQKICKLIKSCRKK